MSWCAPPTSRTLQIGELHIWKANLAEFRLDELSWLSCLSSDERDRAFSFSSEASRNRFIVSRLLMRDVLSQYASVSPASLSFGAGQYGKPYLHLMDSRQLFFNLSHSKDVMLLAVARDAEVGVDVEWIQPRRQIEKIALRYFSQHEREALMEVSYPERIAVFFRIWSRKEAYVKCTGRGLAQALSSFGVSGAELELNEECLIFDEQEGSLAGRSVRSITLPEDGYVAAAAKFGNLLKINKYLWIA